MKLYIEAKITAIVIIGAILNGIALNFFLIPANVLSSGFTGVAQLVSSLLKNELGLSVGTGVVLFILNIPITILAWQKVGQRFTIYSLASVATTMIVLMILPIVSLTDNTLLNAVFGGVVSAIGVGLTLRFGASTGGMDIIAMVLSRMQDRPIGTYFLILNGLIVLSAGAYFGWEKALYTLVTIYASSRVIDAIHTRHEKLTAMIITTKGEALTKAIHEKMVRGITRLPAKGGFTSEDRELMMIVITRYELYTLEQIIKWVDPNAFTNIVETAGIFGFFRPID
ncbi:YitT family protein [Pullulanibacillus sp. KACC 23026]|uniref:YitT family protein n=1 Tax=Pullulanibacillus sp. KACC 23026 TaxID=3028315 RepID=UPI0023AF23C2|nr:YitT family protein [Pullulanibacillus sp. KACC 23026]WEG15028.1 YitT family protein [Pullulanibacillus sp. KACC 23026]